MAAPLGGNAGVLGVPTTYVEDIDGALPWEAMPKIQKRPPPMLKKSMVGPLEGNARDPGAPTTYIEDIDGGPPRRRCWRFESTHHLY
jgi:hypothetical protein